MLEPADTKEPDTAALDLIQTRAPHGAMLIAGIATALVFAMWLAFYFFVFLPRGLLR